MNSLCKHLNKRLAKEAAPSQGHMSNGTGANSGNGEVSSGRQHVSTETQRRVAQIILRMADKAQYSKVGQGACKGTQGHIRARKGTYGHVRACKGAN